MSERFKDWKPPEMVHGEFTDWKWIPYYPENIKIGRNVDIGALCFLQGKMGIEIGDNVQIGAGTKIYSVDTERGIAGKIVIAPNIMIGANSVILPKNIIHLITKHVKAGSVVY